ncbi:MAG: hypothetical protein ACUVQU_02755 [Candidatus Bipolaricaulia bacterium]
MRDLALLSLVLGLCLMSFSSSQAWAQRVQPLSAGGGPILGWLALDLLELNEHLAQAGLPQLEPGLGLVLSGVSYFGERGKRPALAGLAVSGQISASRLDKSVRLHLLLAGLGLEYGEETQPSFGQLGLFVGGFVAPARLTLKVTLSPAEGFDPGLKKPSGTGLTRGFLSFGLYAGGEWAFGLGRLRLSLGYLFAGATTNWRTDGRDFPGPIGAFRGPLLQAVFAFQI